MNPNTALTQRLTAALAAEQAAIHAYGRIGVLLNSAGRTEARAADAVHRAHRDAAVTMLTDLGATVAAGEAGYALPFPVTGHASAVKLALHLEGGVAAVWRAVLPVAEQEDRRAALAAYSAAAVRATRWRKIAGNAPLTEPFPGRTK